MLEKADKEKAVFSKKLDKERAVSPKTLDKEHRRSHNHSHRHSRGSADELREDSQRSKGQRAPDPSFG